MGRSSFIAYRNAEYGNSISDAGALFIRVTGTAPVVENRDPRLSPGWGIGTGDLQWHLSGRSVLLLFRLSRLLAFFGRTGAGAALAGAAVAPAGAGALAGCFVPDQLAEDQNQGGQNRQLPGLGPAPLKEEQQRDHALQQD